MMKSLRQNKKGAGLAAPFLEFQKHERAPDPAG
jgi:hypothetical protein